MIRKHSEISVESEAGDRVDLLCSSPEDADCWVEAITDHMEDRLKWGKAAPGIKAAEKVSDVSEEDVVKGVRKKASIGELMERILLSKDSISSRNR